MSTRSPRPSISELKAVAQPASIFARNSGEHWAGRLYVRRLSPYVTRAFIGTRVSPNQMTWAMLLVGVAAAALMAIPSVWTALGAFLLIQLQILLDCSDGELARWRKQFSPVGIYLDRLAHYVTETAIPIGLGIRCGEPVLGLVAAVLALMVRAETALVAVARLESGLTKAEDTQATAAPSLSWLARLRKAVGMFPFFRVFIAVEASAVSLIAAVVDEAGGNGTEILVTAMVPIAAITAVGHLAATVTSARLK